MRIRERLLLASPLLFSPCLSELLSQLLLRLEAMRRSSFCSRSSSDEHSAPGLATVAVVGVFACTPSGGG
jgi:hypothetical protein